MRQRFQRMAGPAAFGALYALPPLILSNWRTLPPVSLVLALLLVAISLTDLARMRIPDALSLPLALVGLLATAAADRPALPMHLLAAALAGGGFWLLSVAWVRLRGRDGLGLGDAKLALAGGLWLGPWTAEAVLAGASLALVAGLIRAALGRGRLGEPLPFAPFLGYGIWVVWCLRQPLG